MLGDFHRNESNYRAVRNHPVLRDDNDAVPNVVLIMVEIFWFASRRDNNVISNPRIFIDDGVFDTATGTDPNSGKAPGQMIRDGIR